MLVRPQGRAPVRSARLLLSAARPGVRISLFSRADPASSDLGLGPTEFGKDPHHPQVSVEDSRGVAVSALELANSCCTTTNACNTSSIDAILHYTEREEYYSWARYSVTIMAGYEDQADDGYYLDEPASSFEQDLVYALDTGVRHTVNQALAQAIKPIKHHLLGFAEQQAWVAPSGIQSIMEPSLSANAQASKQSNNPHSADFESLIRNMAREHNYNSASQKKAASDPASSASENSSEQGDAPPS
ncbi:hypothetical protein NDU88_002733 [Pleurodeles waltl]|uniref:Uncharacterized protein n=1 Tax=Pleurodeles waltl TaxID=8319 RepID=A0AAV7NIQ9_PLEWA|nr:hypothetical protein NDU88_002733 [Pleurodeles waltl]